ncbi:O-antigen polymerase [Kytococcus sedentarius]|uniref:O-antigen polymerase n=1 Tax=Kytococcus sedentarius TaxID=1276 RepID=UPI0038790362
MKMVSPENVKVDHPEGQSKLLGTLFFIETVLLLGATALYLLGADRWGFAATGILSSWLVQIPIVRGKVPVFSMWGALALVVTVGSGVRGVAIALDYPDRTAIAELFTLDRSFESFGWVPLYIIAGVAAVVFGFMWTVTDRAEGERVSEVPTKAPRWALPTQAAQVEWINIAIFLYAAVGAFFTIRYYRLVGGASAGISDRRTTYTGASDYASHGVEEFLAHAGVVALLLYVAHRLGQRKPVGPGFFLVVAVLSLNAFAINWITTTRADLLYVAFGALVVVRIVHGRVPGGLVGGLAVVVLGGVGLLSSARSGGEQQVSLAFAVDSGLMNRNAFDLSKTMHILDAVPEVLPYQRGATIANYIFAPIPRSVWPDKPLVSPGPIIGEEIYGLPQTGVPPGLVGESVWNFGLLPGIAFCFLVGLFLGLVERKASRWSGQLLTLVIVYAYAIVPLGKAMMGVAVGQAFSQFLQNFALTAPLFMLGLLAVLPVRAKAATGYKGRPAVKADGAVG